jgi:hypothetical protein
VARYHLSLGYRFRRVCRVLRTYLTRAPRPQRDLEAEEIARIASEIGRLEIAAAIGSITAGARLSDMAADRLGLARRRLADEALGRLSSQARGRLHAHYT